MNFHKFMKQIGIVNFLPENTLKNYGIYENSNFFSEKKLVDNIVR